MPYIHNPLRERYKRFLKLIEQTMTLAPGHLNYVISKLIHIYISRKGLSYKAINETIGVLECVKASLIETTLIPYEKIKMKENGNISKLDKEYYEAL